MKVIRDRDGNIINIGEWDYQVQEYMDDYGATQKIISNPYPKGASEADERVITGWDGGLYVEGDPRVNGGQ